MHYISTLAHFILNSSPKVRFKIIINIKLYEKSFSNRSRRFFGFSSLR
jgi:hypothetical protein